MKRKFGQVILTHRTPVLTFISFSEMYGSHRAPKKIWRRSLPTQTASSASAHRQALALHTPRAARMALSAVFFSAARLRMALPAEQQAPRFLARRSGAILRIFRRSKARPRSLACPSPEPKAIGRREAHASTGGRAQQRPASITTHCGLVRLKH